jgi:hypothetical protein
MTVQECVLDLLQFIGVTSFSSLSGANALNRSGLDTRDTLKALAAVNAALQTIQKHGPESLKHGERAAFINAPTILSVNTNATTAQSIHFNSPPPPWIMGCSILVPGDDDINRIVDITGNDISLLRGYRGTTQNGLLATVFADCALLPQDVKAVEDPVAMTPNRVLSRARDLAEFMRYTTHGWDRWHTWNWLTPGLGPSKVIGVPALYIVERRPQGDLYLRLNPMPSAAVNITYQAKLRPEHFGDDALALDGSTDPAAVFTSVTEDDQESVLLPLARWKFCSSHPAFKNAETRQSLKLEYDEAMRLLKNGMPMEVSSGPVRATYI